jgi:hypothetical protein
MNQHTLPELQALRARWLQEARERGIIADIWKVATVLAAYREISQHDTWYLRDGHADRTMEILYTRTFTTYSTGAQNYRHVYKCRVAITNNHKERFEVCCFEVDSLNPKHTNPADDLFVPGKWEEWITPLAARADQIIHAAERNKEEEERAALEKMLLIGVVV